MNNLRIISLLALAFFVGFTTCTRKSATGPGEQKLYVVGSVERYQDFLPDTFYSDEEVFVTNAGVVPSATINDQQLEFDYWGNEFHYEGHFELIPGSEYCLTVTAGSKVASATVFLPSDFNITAPTYSYVLPKGSDLETSWDNASHAACYRVHLYIHYEYGDTSGYIEYFNFSEDSIVSGTNITYGHDLIFPNLSEIDTISWGYGSLSIHAIDGPVLVPGSVGNVAGNGIGFFWAQQERFVYFDVGAANKISKEEEAKLREAVLKGQKELWNRRIEKLKNTSGAGTSWNMKVL